MVKELTAAEVREAQLRVLANTIKQKFREKKSERIGRPYKPSPRHDKLVFWQKAAEQCAALKADPLVYVEAAFDQSGLPGGPFPNTLSGPSARSWYEGYCRVRGVLTGADRGARLNAEMEEIPDAAAPDMNWLLMTIQTVMEVITRRTGSSDISFAALDIMRCEFYRFEPVACVLLGYPDPKIMELYGEQACTWLHNHPGAAAAIKNYGFFTESILRWKSTTTT